MDRIIDWGYELLVYSSPVAYHSNKDTFDTLDDALDYAKTHPLNSGWHYEIEKVGFNDRYEIVSGQCLYVGNTY